MKLKCEERNVAMYLLTMVIGVIVCNIISSLLDWAAISSWEIKWLLLFLAYIVSLLPTIYHFYVIWFAIDDYNKICYRRQEDYFLVSPNYLIVFLLSGVTLGIYEFYWFYHYGNNIKELGRRREVDIREKGSVYLWMVMIPRIVWLVLVIIMMIFGFSIVAASHRIYDLESLAVSGAGFIICSLLIVIAAVCSWIMRCIAWGKWLTNLNRITSLDTAVAGRCTQTSAAGSIQILTGQYKDAVLPVREGEEIILGRDRRSCHLVFLNEHISRIHCGVRYIGKTNQYLVTDYSTNGTFMKGGEQLQKDQPTVCSMGTVVELGKDGEKFILL